jgi:hypothetical protein
MADAVCSALENAGIRCWIAPRDVLPGKEWGEAIVDAIGGSRIMVLIFSSASNKSQQVLREVERAVNKNVIIIPFRIEDVLPTKSMEYFLYSTHWLDALTPETKKHIESLVNTVKKLMKHDGESDTISKPFNPQGGKAQSKKKNLVLYAALGLIIIGLGAFGLISVLSKTNQATSLDQPSPSATTVAIEPSATPEAPSDTPLTQAEPTDQPAGESSTTPTETPAAVTENTPSAEPASSQAPAKTPEPEPEKAKTQLKVGQVIQFGNYYGKPINWRVIHINGSGEPLLLTSEIVTLKPFDASESGVYNKIGDTTFDNKMPKDQIYTHYTQEDMRAYKGSNDWASSNIREWLNSDEKAVKYTTQPPTESAVWYGKNDYDKEKGFLFNFSSEEKALIKPVTHKSYVSVLEKAHASGGSALYDFKQGSLDEVWYNLEDAYYRSVEDKVFLLSVEEALEYIYDRGELLKCYLTEEAIARDESYWYNDLKNNDGGSFMWWLRTPNANTSCEVCIVATSGDLIYSDYAVLCGVGVRPACYLDTSALDLLGSGTSEDPYIIQSY